MKTLPDLNDNMGSIFNISAVLPKIQVGMESFEVIN